MQAAMAAVVSAAGGACPAFLQVASLYGGLCVCSVQPCPGAGVQVTSTVARVPSAPGSGLPFGGADGRGVRELEANPFYDHYPATLPG